MDLVQDWLNTHKKFIMDLYVDYQINQVKQLDLPDKNEVIDSLNQFKLATDITKELMFELYTDCVYIEQYIKK